MLKKKTGDIPTGAADSYLGVGTEFKGSLASEGGTIRLDGNFEGEIISGGHVDIGADAAIKADIVTGSAMIAGQIEGNVTAKERIELRSTARVIGDIKSPVLSIAEGVVLEGRCVIDRGQLNSEPSAPAPRAADNATSARMAELQG